MASGDLRAELECSVCLNIYTDPVTLRCGHNFCRVCIDRVLDTQGGSGGYSSPECREKFLDLPTQNSLARRHQVESLDEASEKKKTTLSNVLQKHLTKREETEERVQGLQEHRRKVEEEAAGDTERVTVLFRDLRRRLEDLEKRVLREISGRAEWISISIRDLEIKKEELSRKIRHIEELCNMTDPQESDTSDVRDTENADILLDGNTAGKYLEISDDRKTASMIDTDHNYPESPERFQCIPQVLSSQSFSSGRHYWELDVGRSDDWTIGMCYPSIERGGWEAAGIGWNDKSWALVRGDDQYWVNHDCDKTPLPTDLSSNRVRIVLDYEAGRISFYDLCDPIRHLHTFTTTFTEPLHAGICVIKGSIKVL